MAAKMASNIHNMPHRSGTFVNSHAAGGPSDVTPDLHLKMSKKIAQLTKVIYALNTKNDEHEAIVQNLKETHEDELQQLISETKDKIRFFQSRIKEDGEQKKRVSDLESCIVDERLRKERALIDFENFKDKTEQRERSLRSEHAEKILSMSKELYSYKKEFEEKMKEFQRTRKLAEDNKDIAIQELSKKHHDELNELMKAHRVRYDEVVREKKQLEEDYKNKLKEIESNSSSSTANILAEKARLEQEFEEKVAKIKALYEKELAVLKQNEKNALECRMKEWEDKEKSLQREWSLQEKRYKDKITVLLDQHNDSEEIIIDLKRQLSELESQLANKEAESGRLASQVIDIKQENTRLVGSIKDLKRELSDSKTKYEEQSTDLVRKTNEVAELETVRTGNEKTIKEHKTYILNLTARISELEKECSTLQNRLQSSSAEVGTQVKNLLEELENLTKEKDDLEQKLKKELQYAQAQMREHEKTMKTEFEGTVSQLKQNHSTELDILDKDYQRKLLKQLQELTRKYEEEKVKMSEEKDKIVTERDISIEALTKRLETSEEECSRLCKLVRDSEQGLGSASSRINNLKEVLNETKAELDRTKTSLNAALQSEERLKKELEEQKNLLSFKMEEADERLKSNLESLTLELNSKWSDKLKIETANLEVEMNTKHHQALKKALDELSEIKDKEKDDLCVELHNEISSLKSQILSLEKQLNASQKDASSQVIQLQAELDEQRRKFEEEIQRINHEFGVKMKDVEELHQQQITEMENRRESEIKEISNHLKNEYQEEVASQMKANKLAIDALKSQAERQRINYMKEQEEEFEKQQESIRSELFQQQQIELEKLTREYEGQLAVLRMQLQRTSELQTNEASEYENQIEDLKCMIKEREKDIKDLDQECKECRNSVDELRHALEVKGQEVLTVRREANHQIRKKEESLSKKHRKEVETLVAEHLRETQSMLSDFNRTQDLLKDKVSALQFMLEEAEERYRQRESRPEDLEMIEMLKRSLAERELDMKKLVDEKRYFQLELLNRETNFNKVFKSSQPNQHIGVINPLMAKTKPGKSGASSGGGREKNISAPTLNSSTRLDPLPSQSVHEKRLNNNKPLPPTPPGKDSNPLPHRPMVYL